jgi:hypothetical protein
MKTLLWLDDVRDPLKNDWLNFSPIGKDVDTHWVTNYQEFIDWIMINGLPDAICFDHDLGSYEETGFDCAKWLVEYCMHNNKKLPKYNIQSANPVGKENIDLYLKNFKAYSDDNYKK